MITTWIRLLLMHYKTKWWDVWHFIRWNLLFFFFFFASFEFVRLYLPIEPFAQGNICMKPMQMFIFALSTWVVLKCAENVSSTSKAVFPDFSPVSSKPTTVFFPSVQYLGICMLRRCTVAGPPLRYGCRAGSHGPVSSIVCSVFSCPACDDVQVV